MWFNRTFMELKLTWTNNTSSLCLGLIVPLWNWNWSKKSGQSADYKGLIVPLWNWNTGDVVVFAYGMKGLIVPLWNWNEAVEVVRPDAVRV